MFLRSERLFLRPGWPEDWREISEGLAADDGVERAASCLAAAPRHALLPQFVITLPGCDGARVIGGIGLIGADAALSLPDAQPELRFWLAPDARGHGFATEAVRAMIGLARALGHRRVLARHASGQMASRRVLEKAGFCLLAEPQADGGIVHAVNLETPNDTGDDGGALRAA